MHRMPHDTNGRIVDWRNVPVQDPLSIRPSVIRRSQDQKASYEGAARSIAGRLLDYYGPHRLIRMVYTATIVTNS